MTKPVGLNQPAVNMSIKRLKSMVLLKGASLDCGGFLNVTHGHRRSLTLFHKLENEHLAYFTLPAPS